MNNRYRRTIRPKGLRRSPTMPTVLAFSSIALVVLVGIVSFLAIDVPAAQHGQATAGTTGRAPATSTQPAESGPATTPTTSSSPGTGHTTTPEPKNVVYYKTSSNAPAIVVTSTAPAAPPTATQPPGLTFVFPTPTGYNTGGDSSGGGDHHHDGGHR